VKRKSVDAKGGRRLIVGGGMPARAFHAMRLCRAPTLAQWVTALYLLASRVVGFGQRSLDPAAPPQPDLSAYALPDGALPWICSARDDSGGKEERASQVVCAACLLTAAPGLPPATSALLPPSGASQLTYRAAFDVRPGGITVSLPPARAPPAALARS
jgi:hypothetical protein